jgi:hypothetical protein
MGLWTRLDDTRVEHNISSEVVLREAYAEISDRKSAYALVYLDAGEVEENGLLAGDYREVL